MTTHESRRLHALAAMLSVGLLASAAPDAAAASDGRPSPVPGLESHAHALTTTEPGKPVADLRPFGAMVGNASVVTLGEATHSSREFTTMHQRVFHFLAREKGFGAFAREISWSTALLLDEYVQRGVGNPREIMGRELETFYRVFDTEEFLGLVESLRQHNLRHDDPVHLVGMDMAYPGRVLFKRVDGYLAEHHPRLRETVEALYRELQPEPGMHLGDYMEAYQAQTLAKRSQLADKARMAVRLLRAVRPSAHSPRRTAYEWTLRHATAIAQSAVQYSFDTTTPQGMADWGRYRDRAMADNVLWWREHTGDKTMVSTMNAHASYAPVDPEMVPDTLGHHLRERLGDDHVNAGFSFAEGSFNSLTPAGGHGPHEVDAASGSNEHTLDKVWQEDYVVDLRTAPRPARRWLMSARPTFNLGGYYDPDKPEDGLREVALGSSYDVLFHLDQVEAATLHPAG